MVLLVVSLADGTRRMAGPPAILIHRSRASRLTGAKVPCMTRVPAVILMIPAGAPDRVEVPRPAVRAGPPVCAAALGLVPRGTLAAPAHVYHRRFAEPDKTLPERARGKRRRHPHDQCAGTSARAQVKAQEPATQRVTCLPRAMLMTYTMDVHRQ